MEEDGDQIASSASCSWPNLEDGFALTLVRTG